MVLNPTPIVDRADRSRDSSSNLSVSLSPRFYVVVSFSLLFFIHNIKLTVCYHRYPCVPIDTGTTWACALRGRVDSVRATGDRMWDIKPVCNM